MAGTVGWLFLTVLSKAIKEKEELLQEAQEEATWACKLQGAMKEEKDLLENKKASQQNIEEKVKAMKEEDIILCKAWEKAATECQLRGIEKVRELLQAETASLRGTVGKVKDAAEEALGRTVRKLS